MSTWLELSLTPTQRQVIESPLSTHIFLEGPAGCGKTLTGVLRLLRLIKGGTAAGSILLLLPQRTLAEAYQQAILESGVKIGSTVSIMTIGGLARRMIGLFWLLVAEEAGFAHPEKPPVFLTMETAQYHMSRLVKPLL